MSIKCKVHNRGPGIQIFYDAEGRAIEVQRGQTVDVEVSEGNFESLKNLFDDETCGLDLVSTDAGDDDAGQKSEANGDAGGAAGVGDAGGGEDTIERLLADVDAGRLSFAELRSRAKALLGNDFPAGSSPKKDDIVELLLTAQKKRKTG